MTSRRTFLQTTALATGAAFAPWPRARLAADPPLLDTFDQRRQVYLDYAWTEFQQNPKQPLARAPFISASALSTTGHKEEALKLVSCGLDLLSNPKDKHNHSGNCGFQAWPGMDFYLRHGALLSDELKARYRQVFGHMGWYRYTNTSNHQLMGATTRCLASEAFGEAAFGPLGPEWPEDLRNAFNFRKDDPTGRKNLLRRIEEVPTLGPGEYASRPYGAQNTLPILTVAEVARDAELRQKAAVAFEVALAQLAPCWLRGHLATFATRSYPDMLSQRPGGIAEVLWLYFGGVPPAQPIGAGHNWALQAAIMNFRPPTVLLAAATDRRKPYRHRALMNKWRLDHFVNRSYALFSRWARGKMWIGQQYPCGVMWDEADTAKHSHLWLTCPHFDSADERGKSPAANDHTHGCTAYEEMLQHERTVLFLYDIAEAHKFHYALGFVPGGALAVANDSAEKGRLFLHYRSVLVAISASKPFAWDPQAPLRMACDQPADGDSEFRVPGRQVAIAVETAHPDEIPGATPAERLAAFRETILGKSKCTCNHTRPTTAHYTDRSGAVLECVFGGENKLNHQPVDYANWPTLDNPWMKQPQGGPLTVTDGRRTRVYDFDRWSLKETGNA